MEEKEKDIRDSYKRMTRRICMECGEFKRILALGHCAKCYNKLYRIIKKNDKDKKHNSNC